ncbi:MAG: hypothetical protein OIF58_14540, partial [Cohaesibacter sp.]|nr:hypothetical protein [Cohaesibacter sp.]
MTGFGRQSPLRKILEDLGTAAAVRINHFAATIFLAHSLWPSVGLEDVERSTWLLSKPQLLERLGYRGELDRTRIFLGSMPVGDVISSFACGLML